jgi:inner membrane protein
MVVLPVLLWLAMRWWAGRRPGHGEALDARWLLALACLGVWSHPLLDLFNTYGVRLLMPFSSRWFYGDTLFIVDPLLLIIASAGILLARRRAAPGAARGALATAIAYVALMASGSAVARAEASAGDPPSTGGTLASPAPLAPLRRDVVRRIAEGYESGVVRLGWPPRYTPLGRVPDGADQPWARWAAGTERGRRFLAWSRFPRFVLDTLADVTFGVIYDMRYGDGATGTWASLEFELPASLQAR